MTFSGPSAACKPNYCCYYFCCCFRCCFRYYLYCRFSPYTARIDLAATAYINLAATYYGPPYCGAARLWSYYYGPPCYGAAKYRSYERYL